jgi:hypothetical protein
MPKWNFAAMGQAGLTGRTRTVAQPVARSIARKTGRPEAQILSLIGAAFLAMSLINFLREVDTVIAAGRTAVSQAFSRSGVQHGREEQRDGESEHAVAEAFHPALAQRAASAQESCARWTRLSCPRACRGRAFRRSWDLLVPPVIARLDKIPELRRVRLESGVINAAQPHVALLRRGEDGRLVRSGGQFETRAGRFGSAVWAAGC